MNKINTCVILAGGFGTRLSEETSTTPKPLVEIGGKPILWHIMKLYSHYGINKFIICAGYKGYKIKEYFANYSLHLSDVTFNLQDDSIEIHKKSVEPWIVTVIDTGENTMTGGRLNRVKAYIQESNFCMTYGDGVSDVNIIHVIDSHLKNNKVATVTAVQPAGRFGALEINNYNTVTGFVEKPHGDGGWINGGFFVLNKKIFEHLHNDEDVFEQGPLRTVAALGELNAYLHNGFWQPMDTLRDKILLEQLWLDKNAPWRKW